MKALMKVINPAGVKTHTNEIISLKNINLKCKISKYHQVTYFMSKIGNITNYFH
jgi:hypothetical protein